MTHDIGLSGQVKLFITGATGFVGQEVAWAAHRAGHSVRLLTRHPNARTTRELAAKTQAEVYEGDVLQPESLSSAITGAEAVIHLVGIISEVGRCTFENVHTEGTRNVVEAAKAAGLRPFVHMSALGTRPNALARYHQTKWAAEEILRQSGLEDTIFRPSLVYGPKDQFVNLFARIARFSPVVPVMGRPGARFQPVSVEVVAAAFVKALREPRANNHAFDLCGPETFTFPELLDLILRVSGRKRWKLHIPTWIARFQASFLEFLYNKLLKRAPPLNRDQLIMLQEDNVGEAERTDELFGLKHPRFEEGIGYLQRNA